MLGKIIDEEAVGPQQMWGVVKGGNSPTQMGDSGGLGARGRAAQDTVTVFPRHSHREKSRVWGLGGGLSIVNANLLNL